MNRVRLPAQPIETVRAADRSASGTSSRNSGERQSSSGIHHATNSAYLYKLCCEAFFPPFSLLILSSSIFLLPSIFKQKCYKARNNSIFAYVCPSFPWPSITPIAKPSVSSR